MCGKREENNERFHRPLNAQTLQQGILTDANQSTLRKARLCDACHAKEMPLSLYTSDAILERIFAKERDEADKHLSEGNIEDYGQTMTVAQLGSKLHCNEAVLLTDVLSL